MAAEEATVDLPEDPAALPVCDHHWIGHLKGGEPLSVRICSLCGDPDWDDLRRQLSELDGATGPGDPRCHSSTPGEFAARWNARTEEERAAHLRWIQEDADVAQHCRLRHVKPTQHGSIGQLLRDVEADG